MENRPLRSRTIDKGHQDFKILGLENGQFTFAFEASANEKDIKTWAEVR